MRKKSFFGKAFNDEFLKFTAPQKHFKKKGGGLDWEENLIGGLGRKGESNHILSAWRRVILTLFLVVTMVIFSARLFHLQIVEGKENRDRADFNRIQVKVIHAPRGVIYDRNGKVLAQNEPAFRLVEASDSGKVVKRISRDEALKMEVEKDPRFLNLEIDSLRSYPFLEKTAHILGYVGEITKEELEQGSFSLYKLGDIIGRGGVEEYFEKTLKGVDGGEIIEIDASGNKLRTLRRTEAIPGQNLYLSIDIELQRIAFEKLKEAAEKNKSCCGAFVAQNPQNGEILALVSYPSFDPQKISEAIMAPNSPMLNRAIAGQYPPASTFKIASSLAGLISGKIKPGTVYEDTGIMALGPFTFSNWYFTQYGRKEGSVDMVKALKRSNDIYYYRLAQVVGEKQMGEVARRLGLGSRLGIDIPGEVTGIIPDNKWKEENTGEVWYPGDSLHMSIGQGFVLSTPLQINNMTSIIAADGKEFPPHLGLKVTSPNNTKIKDFSFEGERVKDITFEHIKVIQEGLEAVPKDGGTAWPFFTFPISTAGKTGTAEFGDPKHTHAWYTAYGPVDHPSIVATALLEAGGEGSSATAPIVKEIFRWYFSTDKTILIKDVSPIIATESAKNLGE